MSVRETGKSQRRDRIVAAARQLIGETGATVLSMRGLADRSGVSLATPYNLFGSKQAIIEAVLAADVALFVSRASELSVSDPIQRIFDVLRLAMHFYRAEPSFYRALFSALFNAGSLDLAMMFNPPRHAFWQGLVQQAVADGALLADTDSALFARALGHSFGAGMLEWVGQEVDLERVETALGYDFALMLAGAATPAHQGALHERVRERQRRLIALRPDKTNARPEPVLSALAGWRPDA